MPSPSIAWSTVSTGSSRKTENFAGRSRSSRLNGPPDTRRGRPRTASQRGNVRVDPPYGYAVLDPTTDIKRKQRLILARKRDGTLGPDRVHVHGAVTAVANYQTSNRADKFGYLMRHPTASNQVGKEVSEATIHSAQFGFTAVLGDWISGHAVMLFDPEQSFGKGINTDLERNQVQGSAGPMSCSAILTGRLSLPASARWRFRSV